MNVNIFSREAIELMIAEDKFPKNTAVISFYDPAVKRIDKNYSHVDYSMVCNDVFYCEVDDLDLDYLPEKGYTYDSFFPEADDMALFIVKAYMKGKNIICQCEYGQSRSAGCAAAILEYFYKKGISVFSDYTYYPNQVVFHKLYDALVKIAPVYSNSLYPLNKSAESTGAVTLFSKNRMEKELTEQGKCFHSFDEAYYQLRHGIAKVYVSLHINDAKVCSGSHQGEHNIGLKTAFTYENKKIPLTIISPKLTAYTKPKNRDYYLGNKLCPVVSFKSSEPISLDVFGIMELDCGEPFIEKAVITMNMPS